MIDCREYISERGSACCPSPFFTTGCFNIEAGLTVHIPGGFFMISFSKLLLEQEHYGDRLRYHPKAQGQTRGALEGQGPIVV
jgi:hypothetical protein